MATGVKKTRSVRPWYGLWHSDANWDIKNTPVWQAVLWPMGLQKPGLSDRGVANGVTKFRMASGGLNWKSFYFVLPRASVAIRRYLPKLLLIVARVRMPSLVNAPICTVAFTAVSYKHPCHKHQSECVHACFWMPLSDEALTCIPHLLRVGNSFLHHFTLTVQGCNIN